MGLTAKQKKHLLKKVKIQKSINQVAQELNTPEEEIKKYLKKRWTSEKYHKFIKNNKKNVTGASNKNNINHSSFNFKTWLKANVLVLILLLTLVLIAYFNSLNNEFLSDDIPTILKSPNLDSFDYITTQLPGFLRPLLIFLTNKVFGRIPIFYRSLNIAFHIGTVFGVYLLASLIIGSQVALLTAILLAIHPLQTESITWISGGPYVMSGFFMIASLISFILSKKNKKLYFLSLIFYALTLFSSERTVIFPLILFSFILSFSSLKKDWKKLIIPSLMAGAWTLMFLSKIPQRISILQSDYYQTAQPANPLVQLPIAISSYLELIVWPKALTLYHSEMHFSVFVFVSKVIILLSFIASLIWSFIKSKKIFFWLSFYIICLLPTLTPFGISWIVAERYAYMAAVGIYAVIAIILAKLIKKTNFRTPIIIIFTIITIALTTRTIVRNVDWKNQDNLWLSASKTSPSSPQNHNNLGDYYARHGDLANAAKEFQTAVQLNPRYADAMHNLANVYFQMEKLDEAIKTYETAIKMNPNLWQSYQNLAYIYFQKEDINKAKEYLEKAISIAPQNANLYQNLSTVYQRLGNQVKAQELIQKAILLDPSIQTKQ